MSRLPIFNVGFKTSDPKRQWFSQAQITDWYKTIEEEEQKQGKQYSFRKLSSRFLRDFLPNPEFRSKVVSRLDNALLIEVYRWLEITKQPMNNHLYLITPNGYDYIKLT